MPGLDPAAVRLVVDVREPPGFAGDPVGLWTDSATALTGACALIGEHVDRRVDDAGRLDVVDVVSIFGSLGVSCIVTVTGRDRTMTEARDEILRLREAGALAVHCVTGDHPAALGSDRTATWGGEAFDLIGIARDVGMAATAAESPASPGPRAARVVAKEKAGASTLILNHAGNTSDVVEFVDRCRSTGATMPIVAPIPIVVDAHSAAELARFPGLRLPDGLLAAVAAADDPRQVGLDRAATAAAELLGSGRIAGLNLSGPGGVTTAAERLAVTRDVLDRLRELRAELQAPP